MPPNRIEKYYKIAQDVKSSTIGYIEQVPYLDINGNLKNAPNMPECENTLAFRKNDGD